jgi:F-box protein 21
LRTENNLHPTKMDNLPHSSLIQLPEELLGVITCHMPSAADTAAFGQTCRRINKIVCTSPVWKRHCLEAWRHWDPRHELAAKLAQPLLQTDWRKIFLQRASDDHHLAFIFEQVLLSEHNRLHRMDIIAEKGIDIQDLLLKIKYQTPDDAEDVLARRWYAGAILRMIYRARAVDVWMRFRTSDGVSTEEALCAFDMFVLGERLGGFAEVESRFDSIAQSIRDSTPDLDQKTIREKALLIAEYLYSKGVVGMSSLAPAVANYHALRNNFITMALFSPTHASLPLQSVSIYCAVARRCGVTATPSNFPRHVHAVVQTPPDQTLDGQPKAAETGPEFLHVDVWQEPHQLYEDRLRLRLLQAHIPPEDHDRQLGPALSVNTLVRASRNILVSVNNARLYQEVGNTNRPLELQPDLPDPMAAQYAAFWALCLLLDGSDATAAQRREYLQVLLQIFSKQFPQDFTLIQNRALPMLVGSPDYRRMEEEIAEITAEDAVPKDPKFRAEETDEIQFRVGHHFQHRRYGYKAFIIGWDTLCEADAEWIETMQIKSLTRDVKQPFYNVVVEDKSQRYVAEENIVMLTEQPGAQLMALAGQYFKRWDDREHKFLSIIKDEYPDD